MCRDDHRISQDKLTALLKWYKENGLQPRRKKSGGRILTKRILSFQDTEMVVQFLLNYAKANAIVLPGRVAAFHRWDVKILPSSETKSSIWRQYRDAAIAAGLNLLSGWVSLYLYCICREFCLVYVIYTYACFPVILKVQVKVTGFLNFQKLHFSGSISSAIYNGSWQMTTDS